MAVYDRDKIKICLKTRYIYFNVSIEKVKFFSIKKRPQKEDAFYPRRMSGDTHYIGSWLHSSGQQLFNQLEGASTSSFPLLWFC